MKKEHLVLIPGAACDEAVWSEQVISLDPVCTIHIPNLEKAKSVTEMAEQTIANLPKHFCLAGHSLGGTVVFEILRLAASRVKKVCLLATTAKLDTDKMYQNRLERIYQAQHGNYEILAQELAEVFTFQKAYTSSSYKMFLRNKSLFIQQQINVLNRPDYSFLLPTIQQKTLVLVGRQDTYFFESSNDIAHNIPHASLKILEQCGHMITMEQAQQTSKLMRDWLTDNSGYKSR